MHSGGRTGTPGSSWAQLLPSRATEQLRDKLSHGDPTTQRAATIWLLKGVLILLKLKGKKKASKKVRHKEEKNEPDEGSGLLSEISGSTHPHHA